ncbi:beta-lactamase regulator AmpE [Catenovulum adriaticum]|uniref:Beta-lactamase regulator AmpE n=1 Tax=Catenovulum adriaticum TaxID=2984846 RepID=A0ABY7AIN3_9ALTE|nr:beta-lactamase regulator AmpE [Catenovulum sp. TS8]WAJ69472.1 beta-lactamase regulator AmpE [Catenovulum sp. TS8]
MTLLSIILVVLLERLIKPTQGFQYQTYYQKYAELTRNFLNGEHKHSAEIFIVLWLAVPVCLVAIIQAVLGYGVLGLVFSAFILFICYGCPQHRLWYQAYLEAAAREDKQACFHYAEQLGQKMDDANSEQAGETLGEALIWVNFRHYFAVIFWFVILGPAGAILYVFARNLAKNSQIDENQNWLSQASLRLFEILVWVPARLTGFAFLFVGHFSKALPVWFAGLTQLKKGSRVYLAQVAKAAEPIDVPESDCLTEPCLMLKLAKRALLFLLSVIAVLTLAGYL